MDKKQAAMAEKERIRVLDYKAVFATDAGKRVLEDLMKRNFVLRPTFSTNGEVSTALNEGRRECILDILANINLDENRLFKIIKKQMDDSKKNQDY